ncbi:MAG: DNA polymerase III subunit delta' C-terminal domain-containing protein [Phycisphaerae bacterium]
MLLRDVEHQAYAQRLIQHAVSANRVPHAYLFHGPDGVGKEKLALGLAELLLCGQPVEQQIEGERAEAIGLERLRTGCGTCEDCRRVAAQTHPDLHMVYRQLNRDHPDPVIRKRKALKIGVDVLRHFVIETVALTPNRGRAKLFIIREADRITESAQNALLKTLEEPPGTTFIILLVTAVDRLLPTTLSRCQVVRFDSLPTEFVRTTLQEMRPDLAIEHVEWYARCSDGSLGRALQWAEDGLCELNRRLLERLSRLSPATTGRVRAADPTTTARSDELAKGWTDESKALGNCYRKRDPDITDTEAGRRGLKTIFQLATTWYADILRFGSGHRRAIVNDGWQPQIEQGSKSIDPPQAIEAINRIARAEHQLDLNANTQLCVETLLSDLTRIGRSEAIP